MAKLHIVSIGGTGHKVLTSLIHLAACGAFRSGTINKINVICIDGDYANGNLERTTNTFKNYRNLYQALHQIAGNDNVDDLVDIDSVTPNLFISLFQDGNESLNMAFNFTRYNAGTAEDELIKFLYTEDEINKEVKGGFYGHTSIGAVMARNILTDENEPEGKAWSDFKAQITDNDHIVVIGSIFGGTGASCIPVVLEELKEKKKNGSGLAAVILSPYFKIVGEPDKNKKVQPDSGNFNIKAKAALNYYEIEKKLESTHALYIIGEPSDNFSCELRNDDGAKQKNKAHPIELFAATAVLDFIRNTGDRRKGKVYIAKRPCVNKRFYCYTWKMLQNVDKDLHILMQTFIRAAVFYNKVIYTQLANKNSAGTWEDYYNDGESTLQTKETDNNFHYINIYNYLKFFVEWIYDLHKKNLNRINDKGELDWEDDTRVCLLNSKYSELFNLSGCSGGNVKNFENLVIDETSWKSEEILSKLNYTQPDKGTGFPALFATLKKLLTEKKNLKPSKHVPQNNSDNHEITNYASQENNVDLAVPTPTDAVSIWVECPNANILGSVAEGLPNTDREAYTKNDVAIPSPWSIFITNEMSLTIDKFKGLNEYAYNQWCGIIALLVLRQLNNYEQGYKLKIERLQFNNLNDTFFKTIKYLSLPKSYIYGDATADWLDCSAVKLGNETIAFLAHNTFVCPAFSISKRAITELHVLDPTIVGSDDEFQNPKKYFIGRDDSNRSKKALQLVLKWLSEKISDLSKKDKNDKIINSMKKLLDQYLKDLGDPVENDSITLPSEQELSAISSVYDVFDLLCIKGKDVNNLPFVLKKVRSLSGNQIALVSLNFSGMNSAELKTSYVTPELVYGQIRADNIKNFAGKIHGNIEIILDTDLLLDSMVMRDRESNSENAFNSLSGSFISGYEVVWPVSERLLELYEPDKLNKMLDVKRENDTVSVTLTLEVDGKIRTHQVTKTYHIKRIGDANRRIDEIGVCSVFEARRLPFWAVWPYAKIINSQKESVWKRYNFFCVDHVYNDSPVFTIEPFFANRKKEDLRESRLSVINENAKEFYYRHSSELPAALRIKEQTDGSPLYRGAVFLNQPEPKILQTSIWSVGVDFGTTSTSVFYTADINDEPQFLQLLNEYRWKERNDTRPETVNEIETDTERNLCILSNSGDTDRDFRDQYFIDKQCLSQKGYTTTFEELENTIDDSKANLFESGRIFWHNYENFKKVNAVEGRREHLKSGIKWENDKKWAARYLNQLLTQITYRAVQKGVREIHWFLSYPTAFSFDDQIAFKNRLKDMISDLDDEIGPGLKHKFEGDNNLMTESVAAALSFRKNNPNYPMFLCLDIGGGTSDISIWLRKELKFQTSVKFASRDMFVAPLANLLERQSVMDKVCTSDVSDGIHTMLRYGRNEANKESIPFLIENVLFEYIINFKRRLDDLQAEDKTALKNFRYLVYIAYAGLFYYLTNLIVALLQNDFKKDMIDRDITDIVIGLSGKGSRLTEWIYWKPIYKTAEAVIKERTGFDITFNQKFKEDAAKTETAYGLICNLDENGRQRTSSNDISPHIFMGNSCIVQNEQESNQYRKDEFVQSNHPFFKKPEKLAVKFDDSSLSDFDEFIYFLDRTAENANYEVDAVPREWYSDKQKRSLLSKMTEHFNNQILDIEHRFDPPFIVMLKVFLKDYSGYLYGEK